MEKYKLEETKSILAFYYSQGAFKDADKRFKEFRKIIIQEAKKRNKKPLDLIDYFVDYKEELLELLNKKDYQLGKEVKEKLEVGLIKAPIHSLDQKFGKSSISGQLTIFDNLEDKELIREAKNLSIKVIGWDLTRAEDQAVFAIQKIYSKYGYRGNVNKNDNTLAFTYAEYFENYGVKKWKTKNNKLIFSSAEKKQSLKALLFLNVKQCIVVYDQLDLAATKKKGKKIFNRIETRSAIIPEVDFLYTGLEEKELHNGKSKINKLKAIKIIPSKVFLDQIGNYYALLPSNLYLEIRDKFPEIKNIHLPMFIQFLSMEIALRRRNKLSNTIEIGFEKLSYKLRMDNWIKAKRQKRIDDRLRECFKQAKILGYLNWYRIGSGKTVTRKATLSINIDKFKSTKQIKEIIDGDYTEKEHIEEVKKTEDSEIVKKQKERIRAVLGLPKR